MGAFSELSKYYSQGIVVKATELGYSDVNLLILQGNESAVKENHPDTWSNLLSCVHHRDRRTPLEYAQDLVASWLFEDSLIEALSVSGLNIKHAGADKKREILSGNNVSSYSDAEVFIHGNSVPLEIMCDYTGYWTRTNRIDLRDSKFIKLKKSNSLFLGFSTVDNRVILLDFSENISVTYSESHRAYGGKPAYSIHISDKDLFPFKIKVLKGAIEKLL